MALASEELEAEEKGKVMEFFEEFLERVKWTPHWQVMVNTVEASPWHREANVAVHTEMTIAHYNKTFAHARTARQRTFTRLCLLFHDFGKPEAEETLEKKEEPGVFYRRYAGHEPISANEFMSFMCDHHSLRELFFKEGFSWVDLRAIKVAIEHHLPYGLKKEDKRIALRSHIAHSLGEFDDCYFDMLRSDAAGRISDDMPTKLQNVEDWIAEFAPLPVLPINPRERFDKLRHVKGSLKAIKNPGEDVQLILNGHERRQPVLVVPVGITGAGKSTWIKKLMDDQPNRFVVYEEDVLRVVYAMENFNEVDWQAWENMSIKERYDAAWKFCHLDPRSKFDAFAKADFIAALGSGKDVIVDKMNQGRKARTKLINEAKQRGFMVTSVEFFISEGEAKRRQRSRGDKAVPDYRVHQIAMQLETPWVGSEVDEFEIIPLDA